MENFPELSFYGLPVAAIHGTHERRVRGLLNPMEALEKAGFLFYIHGNGIILEKGNEKVCIQGFGGVPDQFAETVMKEFDFRPAEGCFNIFVLHQSLSGFVKAPLTVPLESLPPGFDLYICGHVHEPKKSHTPSGRPLLIAGSTIQTQLTKESGKKRGIWHLETGTGALEFEELENQRPVYYMEFKSPDIHEITERMDSVISGNHGKKPVVRIKVDKLPRGLRKELESAYGEKVMLSFKSDWAPAEFSPAGLEERKLSVQELGMKFLRKNMKDAGLEPRKFESVFELLENRNTDAALDLLMGGNKKEIYVSENGNHKGDSEADSQDSQA